MFHPQAFNSKHYNPPLDLKVPKNNFNHLEPKAMPTLAAKRSKSTNIRKLPLHQPLSNINRSVDILHTDPSPKNGSESARILLSRPPSLKGNTNAELLLPIHNANKKSASISPEKRRAKLTEENREIFRVPDIAKIKTHGFEAVAVPVPQFNLKPQEGLKPKAPAGYVPTRSISNITLKQGMFNEGLIAKQSSVKQVVLPFKAHKDHFTFQSPAETRPSSKRNKKLEQASGPIEVVQSQQVQNTEQDDALFQQIDDRVKARKSVSDVKLPKLQPVNIIKKKANNDSSESIPSINTLNVNLSINSANSVQNKQALKEASMFNTSSSTKRPPRSKVRSYDRNDPTKVHLFQPDLLDPQSVLSQHKILIRKGTPELSKNSPSKLTLTEHTERSVTPVRLRTQSIAAINTQTATSFGTEPLDPKIIANFAFKTRAGALPNKPVKTNQDAYTVYTNFAGHKDKFFFAVSDGHGVNGHLVSNYIKQNLPKHLENHFKTLPNQDDAYIKEMLMASFKKTNQEIFNSTIDINFSGSTTVSTLIFGSKLWCANVGDSRAVIAKQRNKQWIASPLSIDHKPDSPEEMTRILASGGRVDTFRDHYGEKVGPYRVWLKDENIPGLAMARSLGDGVAASVGVIAEPEIIPYDLEEDDKFIIIASDGVWEFLENQQVVDYIVPFYLKNQLESACEKVVRESVLKWKEEDEVIDDITCIIISLKVPPKQKTN